MSSHSTYFRSASLKPSELVVVDLSDKAHAARLERLKQAGFEIVDVDVCVLTNAELKYVRDGLTEARKLKFETDVKREIIKAVAVEFAGMSGAEKERIVNMRVVNGKRSRVKHHPQPLRFMPKAFFKSSRGWGHAVHRWHTEGHHRLILIGDTLHDDIHQIIDRHVIDAFGDQKPQEKGQLRGTIGIPMKDGLIWDMPGPDKNEAERRFTTNAASTAPAAIPNTPTTAGKRPVLTLKKGN